MSVRPGSGRRRGCTGPRSVALRDLSPSLAAQRARFRGAAFLDSIWQERVAVRLTIVTRGRLGHKRTHAPYRAELATRFKFATQKSKLAGTIRGSFFVIKGES